jgi:hypothetical protein
MLLCGLMVGAFILTLAFSSWHHGLWRADAAPVMRTAQERYKDSLAPIGAVAPHPSGSPTAAAAPAAAAMNPPPAIAPSAPAHSEPESEPNSAPDVDNGARLARRERGTEHGSRSR